LLFVSFQTQNRKSLDKNFGELANITTQRQASARIRFMIQDILEMRKVKFRMKEKNCLFLLFIFCRMIGRHVVQKSNRQRSMKFTKTNVSVEKTRNVNKTENDNNVETIVAPADNNNIKDEEAE